MDWAQGALVSQVISWRRERPTPPKPRRRDCINGRPVKDAAGLRNTIGLLSVGDRVDISLLRDGKPRRVTAVIAERDTAAEARANNTHSGLEGAELTDAASGAGVLIRSVAEGSPRQTRACAPRCHRRCGSHRVASLDGSIARRLAPQRSCCRSARQRNAGDPDPLTIAARCGVSTCAHGRRRHTFAAERLSRGPFGAWLHRSSTSDWPPA
jgi:hypothetical protein